MTFEQHIPFDAYSSKRVSFILTTKNRAERLDGVLALAQEYVQPEDELIVVDGLSTDNTVEIISRHSDIVDIFISERDVSVAHGLNKGMLLAQGKYIRHICDDDILHPDALEQAIQVLEEHPEVDLLVCGGTKERGGDTWTVWLPPGTNYGKSIEDVFRYKACGAGFIIRRRALSLIGLHPTGPAADHEFVLQSISRGANVKFCRVNLYHHPIHDHSVIISSAQEHQADDYRLVRQYCSKRFYYWYRILRIAKKHPKAWRLLTRLTRAVDLLRRKSSALGQKHSGETQVWDAGFS